MTSKKRKLCESTKSNKNPPSLNDLDAFELEDIYDVENSNNKENTVINIHLIKIDEELAQFIKERESSASPSVSSGLSNDQLSQTINSHLTSEEKIKIQSNARVNRILTYLITKALFDFIFFKTKMSLNDGHNFLSLYQQSNLSKSQSENNYDEEKEEDHDDDDLTINSFNESDEIIMVPEALMIQKRYPCEYCHMSFQFLSTKANHMITHTGEKPFKCDKCNKDFGLKSLYKTHCGGKKHKKRMEENNN
jgi:hypothetical protein